MEKAEAEKVQVVKAGAHALPLYTCDLHLMPWQSAVQLSRPANKVMLRAAPVVPAAEADAEAKYLAGQVRACHPNLSNLTLQLEYFLRHVL